MSVRVAASQFALVLDCWQYSPLQNTWSAMCSEELRNLRTVVYARTNVIGSRTSFVITSVRSSLHWNICI